MTLTKCFTTKKPIFLGIKRSLCTGKDFGIIDLGRPSHLWCGSLEESGDKGSEVPSGLGGKECFDRMMTSVTGTRGRVEESMLCIYHSLSGTNSLQMGNRSPVYGENLLSVMQNHWESQVLPKGSSLVCLQHFSHSHVPWPEAHICDPELACYTEIDIYGFD